MEKIKVKIGKDGSVEYTVEGVKGKGCRDLTKAIDQLSGGDVADTRNTSEFCQLPDAQDKEKVRGR